MGYKNNWHRENVETRQVTWQQPLQQDQAVAIIGGGISGLACAQVSGQQYVTYLCMSFLDTQTRTLSLPPASLFAAAPDSHCSNSLHGFFPANISSLLLHSCGQGLAQHAMKAVVFDTGEHGVGGRAATRTTTDPSIHKDWLDNSSSLIRSAGLLFDHAAQCFTATDPAFQQQCKEWEAAGAIRQWQGPVGTLKPGGAFQPFNPSTPLYVAVGGMRQLAEHMAEKVRQQG
jgi:hypothetical protein